MKHHVTGARFVCIHTDRYGSDGGTYKVPSKSVAVVTTSSATKLHIKNDSDRGRMFSVSHQGVVEAPGLQCSEVDC